MALLYAETGTYKARVSWSRRVVEKALSRCASWYIALSGGKDSTCVLSLVREREPGVPAVCSLPEWALPETREYLKRVDNLDIVASGSDHNTGWSQNWRGSEDVPAGIRWLGDKGAVEKNYGRAEGGVFLGLREEESGRRRVHLRSLGSLYFAQKNNVWQCNPVARWSTMDVWAFIFSNNLDYNQAYTRLDEIGIPLERQRIGPFAVESALGYGQLAILKRGWPELFNEYAARHPEARLYV